MANANNRQLSAEDIEKRKNPAGQHKTTIITIAAIAILFIVLHVVTGFRFITTSNMLGVLTNSVVTALIVLGFCFIFTMGITDLSIGAIMVLASNVGGILAVDLGLGYVGLFVGSVGTAVLLQMFNLLIMQKSKIPSWILGLGMTMVYEAIGSIYSSYKVNQGLQVVSLGDHFRELGAPPFNIILLAVAVFAAYIIYNRTSIGFALRAVGSNKETSRLMGINITKTIFVAGLIGGIFIGLASAVNQSYAGRVTPTSGLSSIAGIFTGLASFLLAGSLQKAFNITVGAVISAFLITALFNVLTLLGVPSGTMQEVIMGASVLVTGILSQRGFKGVVK